MQTLSGRVFDFDSFSGVEIEDIAGQLAKTCRFNGACRVPYSVAEHSVRVALLIDDSPTVKLAGLLHDAAEAYTGGIVQPFKRKLGSRVKHVEKRITRAILQNAGLSPRLLEEPGVSHKVKLAGETLLATERRDLMAPCTTEWRLRARPLRTVIRPWGWRKAERRFLDLYSSLKDVC